MGEENVYMSAHHAHPFTVSDLIYKTKCISSLEVQPYH